MLPFSLVVYYDTVSSISLLLNILLSFYSCYFDPKSGRKHKLYYTHWAKMLRLTRRRMTGQIESMLNALILVLWDSRYCGSKSVKSYNTASFMLQLLSFERLCPIVTVLCWIILLQGNSRPHTLETPSTTKVELEAASWHEARLEKQRS